MQYVENCSPRIKKFKTLKAMNEFIKTFQKKHGINFRGDNWLDYSATYVTGNLKIYDPSVTFEDK